MPFTFSHPAVVLPATFLPQRWYSLTGLVIGSMVPDFEYFLRMKIQSSYSHTIAGLFWFDLPLALLLAVVFHGIVRNSLYGNVPIVLKSRLCRFTKFSWLAYVRSSWLVVLLSVLLGAASHLFWDSFTHSDGYFVKTIPTLSSTATIFGLHIKVLKILQHGSTILGLLVIALVLFRLPKDRNVRSSINPKYWITVLLVAAIAIVLRLFTGLDYKQYGHLIVTIISGVLLGLVLAPLLVKEKPLV